MFKVLSTMVNGKMNKKGKRYREIFYSQGEIHFLPGSPLKNGLFANLYYLLVPKYDLRAPFAPIFQSTLRFDEFATVFFFY